MTIPYDVKKSKISYDRLQPYEAPLVECRILTKPGSSKEILHIVCDLSDSDITYEVGSSFGILPENLPHLVHPILDILGPSSFHAIVETKSNKHLPLEQVLTQLVNIHQLTSLHYELVYRYHPTKELEELLSDKTKLRAFNEENDLFSFLLKFWHPSIPLQELVNTLPPMLPRYYSCASSMKKVGPFAHFMCASFSYLFHGRLRESVTASFLKACTPSSKIRLFPHPNETFTLPKDPATPIIMIGPGTGLAAFRGFLQERDALVSPGKNWLFTGDRQKAFDFHYEEELIEYTKKGLLNLSTAFSRDGEKIYVQDLMLQEQKNLWSWIHKEGAYVYISGDAKSMAKDVQNTLHLIAEQTGNLTPEEAKLFFKTLKKEGRLLLDIY